MTLYHKKLVAIDPLSPEQLAALRNRFPQLAVVDCSAARDRIAEEVRDAHIVVGRLEAAHLAQARHLELVQVFSQGVEHMMYPAFRARSVVLSNGKGIWSPAMAEVILGFILAFYRRLPEMIRWQHAHQWCPDRSGFRRLADATVGFLGTGDIAEYTVPLCRAFGARIIGYNQHGERPAGFDEIYSGGDRDAFLQAADVVVSTLPKTPETHHFMDQSAFAAMQPDALFINVGRGGTVDEAALVEALRTGELGGAGLDVTETEPLPPESPLWDLPNVIITGHTAGLGRDVSDVALTLLCDNIDACLSGRPYRNVVDLQKGY